MAYKSLEECLLDLERNRQLVRVTEEVDPCLEMAAVHLRVFEAAGPAILFERVKGSPFRAASNIFGTRERSHLIFRKTLRAVQQIIELKNNPVRALKQPFRHLESAVAAWRALPLKNPFDKPVLAEEIQIRDLPQIQHWPMDGGAFITLPQVYTEDPDDPGIMRANLGMYRIQLSGNDYIPDQEIGLHYQIHRGIGVHQAKASGKGQPLKVSVFVGGPPAHTVAAVMPLPEGISEMTFAGVLGGRRFRYTYRNGYCISTDADFVITGEILGRVNKPEGPFGDHLGYYSLRHNFPVMKVHKVYARRQAIWPFTVVGRPPQEDTSFSQLIHEITGTAISAEIPGLKDVHAVDAAGVHPLLLATGKERYTPYAPVGQPAEILTVAHHILGTGQLSLAKYLFITADENNRVSSHEIEPFLQFLLKRIHTDRDIHFHTHTTMDTLDYSGTGLNTGSKVVFAAYGDVIRELCTEIPDVFARAAPVRDLRLIIPGIVAMQTGPYQDEESTLAELSSLDQQLKPHLAELKHLPLIIWCDDAAFTAASLSNFLWVAFTKSNPSHDLHGISSFTAHKHWGCHGPLIIDARTKPHHAPPLVRDPAIEKKIDRLFAKRGSLYQKLGSKVFPA
jgi:4-hydroxy-3-polyprenylbenzoate decarboxylase